MLVQYLMRNRYSRLAGIAVLLASATSAATFGKVVPIGGHAADIALDESRGRLYIANFTANHIDVMSTSDNRIVDSILDLFPQPGGLALSPDGNTLLVTYSQNGPTTPMGTNAIRLRNLVSGATQTLTMEDDAPLAAAFLANGQALVASTRGFYLVDPQTGALQFLISVQNLALSLPVPLATFPPQILQAAMTASADGRRIWGVADAGTGKQLIFMYNGASFTTDVWVTSPPLLPRVSVAADGSWAMIGWAVFAPAQCGSGFMIRSRYPNATGSATVTAHAVDSRNDVLYAQVFDATQPSGPPYDPTTPAGQASPAKLPALSIMDADNLAVNDQLYLPENLVGRAVLNSAATVMYAISDSGVTVLPVGSLNSFHRLAASKEDLLVQSSFCNRGAMGQTFVLSDPGGNPTDFTISTAQKGVTVTPMSGTTPATVTVTVDPAAIPSTFGTTAVNLQIASSTAVNLPRSVRLLISNPDQDQRGTIVNVPGRLSDILPDPGRNLLYVLRQDKNQLLVFDGATNQLKTALRTGTTPTRMSFSSDQKSLMVAHQNSQLLYVYDLDALQPQTPIMLPSGHFGRSLAQSNNATLVLAEDDCQGPTLATVDRVNFESRCAYTPASLGVYKNPSCPAAGTSGRGTGPGGQTTSTGSTALPATTVLSPSPNQDSILLAAPDGNVMLYSAAYDTFVLSRKDLTSLSGGYAVSGYAPWASDSYPVLAVVGDHVFDQSLVPTGSLDTSVGNTAGFMFTGAGGYRVSGTSKSGAGVIQNMASFQTPNSFPAANLNPVHITEAPTLPTTDVPFTRTVAPMPSAGTIAVLSTSGVVVLPGNYDAAFAPPSVTSVVNAADGGPSMAPGGLISVFGQQLSPVTMATSQMPLPTALGDSCLSVNGTVIPIMYVSPGQINAQLPFNVSGAGTLVLHTPGGISNNVNISISAAAPSVFRSGTAGPISGIPTVIRAANNDFVTPSNPIHPDDHVTIYLTGMGMTAPAVDSGAQAPFDPLSSVLAPPTVTLGGVTLPVEFAGLTPGLVGVYQINAAVPFRGVPTGFEIPLSIMQGGSSTSIAVRVVD